MAWLLFTAIAGQAPLRRHQRGSAIQCYSALSHIIGSDCMVVLPAEQMAFEIGLSFGGASRRRYAKTIVMTIPELLAPSDAAAFTRDLLAKIGATSPDLIYAKDLRAA